MTRKRSVDRQREAAIILQVGDYEDNSEIKEFISTNAGLYAIKEKGVFKIGFADDIDPDRTNPNIPNLSQKILSAGYCDEVVARILLTAKYLFDERHATVSLFVSSILEGSIEVTRHLIELRDMVTQLKEEIDQKGIQALENQKPNAFYLPSIPDINTKVHNILVKTDKSKDAVLSLYKSKFFSDAKQRPSIADYGKTIQRLFGAMPEYVSAWEEAKSFFDFVRNARNASEHPKEGQKIVLNNFTMNSEGIIISPLIEAQHEDTPIGRLPLSEFIQFIFDITIAHAENCLVYIKCVTLMESNPFGELVAEFDLEARRHPLVRYYRAININGDNIMFS